LRRRSVDDGLGRRPADGLGFGARFIEALLRSLDLRLGLVQRGGEILGVHAGDDLAGLDGAATSALSAGGDTSRCLISGLAEGARGTGVALSSSLVIGA
jgi:hypothetical protein